MACGLETTRAGRKVGNHAESDTSSIYKDSKWTGCSVSLANGAG